MSPYTIEQLPLTFAKLESISKATPPDVTAACRLLVEHLLETGVYSSTEFADSACESLLTVWGPTVANCCMEDTPSKLSNNPSVSYVEKMRSKTFYLTCSFKQHKAEFKEWARDTLVTSYQLKGVSPYFVSAEGVAKEWFQLRDLVEEGTYAEGTLFAAVKLGIPLELMDQCYIGTFKSMKAFAKDYITTYTSIIDSLLKYVKYQKLAQDLLDTTALEYGNHYFWKP